MMPQCGETVTSSRADAPEVTLSVPCRISCVPNFADCTHALSLLRVNNQYEPGGIVNRNEPLSAEFAHWIADCSCVVERKPRLTVSRSGLLFSGPWRATSISPDG